MFTISQKFNIYIFVCFCCLKSNLKKSTTLIGYIRLFVINSNASRDKYHHFLCRNIYVYIKRMSLTWIYSLYHYAECLLSLSITNIYFIMNIFAEPVFQYLFNQRIKLDKSLSIQFIFIL